MQWQQKIGGRNDKKSQPTDLYSTQQTGGPVCRDQCDVNETWDVRIVSGSDGLPMHEQVKQYLGASVLVLGHGAGMVHTLWMRESENFTYADHKDGSKTDRCDAGKSTVIEVGTTSDLKYDYLARLSSLITCLDYVQVICGATEDAAASTGCGRDLDRAIGAAIAGATAYSKVAGCCWNSTQSSQA